MCPVSPDSVVSTPPPVAPLPPKAEVILAAATRVFLAAGYAGTSMDRVAQAAGVSKHTIYHHFADKRGLFSALIERLVLRRFYSAFGDGDGTDMPPRDRLCRLAEVLLTLQTSPDYIDFLRLLIAESKQFPELAQLYTEEVIQRGHDCFVNYVANHPDLHFAQPSAIAQIFFGSLIAYILSQEVLQAKRVIPLDATIFRDTLVDTILAHGRAGA
jgi:TetR/AcrR family transcriptional regulator of autoinduction and epiphytic fitness